MLLPAIAPAQLFQNSDMYYLAGPSFARTQTIGDSGVTLYGSTGYSWAWGFGHQFHRVGAASLWFDIPLVIVSGSHQTATIPGSISQSAFMVVPAVRLMLPLSSRISVYASAGGGGAFFDYPAIEASAPPLSTNTVTHGALRFGGGVDFRLAHFFSLRVDVTDYVTGRGLVGVAGPNHLLPTFGFVLH